MDHQYNIRQQFLSAEYVEVMPGTGKICAIHVLSINVGEWVLTMLAVLGYYPYMRRKSNFRGGWYIVVIL